MFFEGADVGKRITYLLLGDTAAEQSEFIPNLSKILVKPASIVAAAGQEPLQGFIRVETEEVKLCIFNLQNSNESQDLIKNKIATADVALLILKPQAQELLPAFYARAKREYLQAEALMSSRQVAIFKVIINIPDNQDRTTLNEIFSTDTSNLYTHIQRHNLEHAGPVKGLFEATIQEAINYRCFAEESLPPEEMSASISESKSGISENKQPNIWSRASGALIAAILSILTAAVINNPVTATIDAVKYFWREKNLFTLIRILLMPTVNYPRQILFNVMIVPINKAWQQGFEQALYTPQAVINLAIKPVEINYNKNHKRNLPPSLAKRDIAIAWLIIGLITVSVLAVIFPATFGIAAILPSIVSSLGLTSLSTGVLATLAGVVCLLLCTIPYGIASAIYDGDMPIPAIFKNNAGLSFINRLTGAITAAIAASLLCVVFYQPIVNVIARAKMFWHDKTLLNFTHLIYAPVELVLKFLFSFNQNLTSGWMRGFKEALGASIYQFKWQTSVLEEPYCVNGNAFHQPIFVSKRDLIAAWFMTGLITVAVLAVIFPATFGIAAVLPALVTTLGLAGLSVGILAAVAGIATFIVATAIYGIGSQVVDYITAPKQPARLASESPKPDVKEDKQRVLKDDVAIKGAEAGLFSGFSRITSACYYSLCGKSKASSTNRLELEENKGLLKTPTL